MKLKISKKMASLIHRYADEHPAATAILQKIDAPDTLEPSGAVIIPVEDGEIAFLRSRAGERLTILDSALQAATTDEERKPHFGEHSAWRALMRQIEPQT